MEMAVSAAQIDRILASRKVREGKGRYSTKTGRLLKRQIPFRTKPWQVDRLGYLEANTVADCGESLEGEQGKLGRGFYSEHDLHRYGQRIERQLDRLEARG